MAKKIRTWEELLAIPPNGDYMIVDLVGLGCSAWIYPVVETEETESDYLNHHVYLSTHSFYKEYCEKTTNILQRYGFDVEIIDYEKEDK